MYLRIHHIFDLVFGGRDQKGAIMSSDAKAAKTAEPLRGSDWRSATVKERPTVTTSGQVIWSTRDLLFPSGHAVRSASKGLKKD